MAHKRYIKRDRKLYGPYFYESHRDEDGKVRNTYLGNNPQDGKKQAKTTLAISSLALAIIAIYLVMNAIEITGLTTVTTGTTNLTILSGTEKAGLGEYYYSNRSTNPSTVMFTANYTTTGGDSINGNCTIAFNTTGISFTDPFQMAYNNSVFKGSYTFNYSFDRRGIFQYNITCNATGYSNLSIIDYFNISNTEPYIPGYPSGFLSAQTCSEDTVCTYNFSSNVTDYDLNDLPITNFEVPNAFSCLTMNRTKGIATVNCTTDSATGIFNVTMTAYDGAGAPASKQQSWTIIPVNDPPQFNTTNWNLTAGSISPYPTQDVFFSYDINAWDEENGSYPNLHYWINTTQLGGVPISINDTTGNISFLPTNAIVSQVWNINVSVNDTTGLSNSSILQIYVSNINDAPNLTVACSPNLTVITTEDQLFECWINATDADTGDTETFSTNYSSLFAINSSAIPVEGGKAAVLFNLTPSDSQVGTWWVRFAVTDSSGATDNETVNFTIINVEEWPFFTSITNFSVYANVPFRYDVNASDNDTLTQRGDHFNFTDNTTLFTIDISTGVIDFTPSNASAGTHWINITVNDSTDRSASIVINFTILSNTAPRLTVNGNYSITEGINYYTNLSLNFTDTEGDSFSFTDNSTLFNIQAYGNLTINATEDDVGTHWVIVNATDSRGAVGTYTLNFTIYNVNEAPTLFNIISVNTSEGSSLNFNISANDSDLLNSLNNENLTFRFNYSWIEFTKANATTARAAFTIGANMAGNWSINCTVNDTGGKEASRIFYMNINNSADYPRFTYVCNNELTQTEDTNVLCRINATDLDAGAQLNFTANYSWFLLNLSRITVDGSSIASSLVNFTPTNISQVGNWSINISVSDGVYINTTILYMNISSVNDIPNITTRAIITSYTLHNISYNISATDEEDGSSGSNGNLTFMVNDSRFAIGLRTGLLQFSPNATQNGTYWANVTVNDTSGLGFSYVFNVTVYKNSAPTCTLLRRILANGTIAITTPPTNFTMTENESTGFLASCSDAENDTIYYNWFWNGALNLTGTVTATSWNYTSNLHDRGDKNITLIVTDLTDNSSYYWNVTVYELNLPPQLIQNIPNITSSGLEAWVQNTNQILQLTTYFSDPNNDSISYDWYYYGINESFNTIADQWTVISGTWNVSNNVTNYFYNQSSTTGNRTVRYSDQSFGEINSLEAKIRLYENKIAGLCIMAQGDSCDNSYKAYLDGTNSKVVWEMQKDGAAAESNSTVDLTINNETWYWLKVRARGDSVAVYYSNNSVNYTMAYNVTTTNYTSGKVILFASNTRADFDDIVLKSHDIANFTLSLNTNTSNITLAPATNWYGQQPMKITASDNNGTTESNQFYLIVSHAAPSSIETVTSQVPVSGGATSITTVASLDIIVPSIVTLNQFTKTLVPIILNNSGRVPLKMIDLTAFANESQIKLNLDKNNWDELGVGKQVTGTLEVDIGALAPERYVIELVGKSKDPQIRQTAKINIDVREREAALKTQLLDNIQFTRDLFLQNPECLELNELLDNAQKLYDEEKYQEGLDIVKKANDGCKSFLAKKEETLAVATKNYLLDNWKIILAELTGLIVTIMLIIYYFSRRKFRQKPQFT